MTHNNVAGKIIQIGILFFWTIFWFLNVLDKFIGGKIFLWVGKDRLAQFVKFFSSIGVQAPSVALFFLIVITILEVVALVFLAGALLSFFQKDYKKAQSMFFWGSFTGLVIFSFFTIGDQIFGDRFELLEHTMFWVAIVVSWAAYIYFPKDRWTNEMKKLSPGSVNELRVFTLIIIIASFYAAVVLNNSTTRELTEASQEILPVHVGEGIYRFDFPFISNRSVLENSLLSFTKNNPQLKISELYTAPNEFKNKADNVVLYVFTKD